MPFKFLDDSDATVSSPPVVKPTLAGSSVSGAPKSTPSNSGPRFLFPDDSEAPQVDLGEPAVSTSFKFTDDKGELPTAKDLQDLIAQGYKPTNEDLRTLYQDEQNTPTLTKLGRGIKEGAVGIAKPFIKAPGEFMQDPSASRLLSSAGEGITSAAAGTVGMAVKPFTAAYDYLFNSPYRSPEDNFQQWRLNYLQTHDVGATPLPNSIMQSWADFANRETTPDSAMVKLYPNVSSVIGTVASLPMFEAGAEASGLNKLLAAPDLNVSGKLLSATGKTLKTAGKGFKWVGEIPERVAEGATKKIFGPEMAERIGSVVNVGEAPAAATAALLGHHAVAAGIAGAKALEKAAPKVSALGEYATRLSEADPASPFGRLYSVAKDSSAPEWMRALSDHWITKIPAAAADTTGTVLKSAGVGALFGAGLGAISGDDAEQIGQNIGGGAVFGGITGLTSAPAIRKARVLQNLMGDVDNLYQAHIADGISPEALKHVGNDAMTWAATAQRILGNGAKVRFVDESAGSPMPEIMRGQAGYYQPESNTIWVNTSATRDVSSTLLHELFHPIFNGEVSNRPELGAHIDQTLADHGLTLDAAKRMYIEAALQHQLKDVSDPAQREAAITSAIQSQDNASQQTWGDPNSWMHSEILSEAAARSLFNQHPILDVLDSQITSSALSRVKDFLTQLGVSFKEKPGTGDKPATFLPGFENVIDSPALRKTVYSLLKAQKEHLPGLSEAVPQGVKLNKEMWGKHPGATLEDRANGQKGNDFVVQKPNGQIVERPPREVKKIVKNRRKEVNELYPTGGTPLPTEDKTPGVAVRNTPSGLVERSGTHLGPGFDSLTSFGAKTKANAHDLENAIANGESRSGWYQQIGEGPEWKQSVGRDTGAIEAQHKEFIPINFLVDKQGNLLVRNYSLTAFDRKAGEWAQRKGPISLELWGGDMGHFKNDVMLYLKNHADNLPGEANNLGTDKKNVINAFLVGGNRTFEAKNPLRNSLRGPDRQGIVRSYRLDRLETLEPGQAQMPQPQYHKQVVNLSPDEAGEQVLNDAIQQRANSAPQLSPDVKEEKGKLTQPVGEEKLSLVHLSSNPGLKEVDPKFFGKGKANRNDLSGGNKSYWFVEGSPLQQDVNVFGQGGYKAYKAEVPGKKIYDLRADKPDVHGYFDNINRYEADEQLKKLGYDGVLVETADGRNVAMLFKPQKVKPVGDFKGEAIPKGKQFSPDVEEKQGQTKFNEDIRKNAEDYMETTGRFYKSHQEYKPIDEDYSKAAADFYETAKHDPSNPEVQKAYSAFGKETVDQWKFLADRGVKMEPWTGEGQPYKNSADMTKDVRDNSHLYFFPTEKGFGTTKVSDHPLLAPSGIKVGDQELLLNDVFRAVHDYFGHAKEGFEFGPRGEYNAFLAHSKMYSKDALPAMSAETMGQNSWVNFGQHIRNENGEIPKKGEPGYTPLSERQFAEQKATLLPPDLRQPGMKIPKRTLITLTGQKGEKYPAYFDGYQDMTQFGMGMVPQFTSLKEIPGVIAEKSTTYGPTLEKAGIKMPDVSKLDKSTRYSKTIAEETLKNGGTTFNIADGKPVGKSKTFGVSIYPERSVILDPKDVTADRISSFITRNQDLLSDKQNCVGTWFDKSSGKVYLDVSLGIKDKEFAKFVGDMTNQKAIWDSEKGEEIPLTGTGEPLEGLPPAESRLKFLERAYEFHQSPGLHSQDLMQAPNQFRPPTDEDKEYITAAALRTPEGKIATGTTHAHAFMSGGPEISDALSLEDGFITNKGRFVDRDEAKNLALSSGQIDKKKALETDKHYGLEKGDTLSPKQPLEALAFQKSRAFSPDVPKQVAQKLRRASPVVKDEKGVPKLFFHGTTHAESLVKSGQFATEKQDVNSLYGPGFYFTDDAPTAGGDGGKTFGYANTKLGGDSAGVVPAYLDVKNPFNIDETYHNGKQMARQLVLVSPEKPKMDLNLQRIVNKVLRDGEAYDRNTADILVDNDRELHDLLKGKYNEDSSVSDYLGKYLDWKMTMVAKLDLVEVMSNVIRGEDFYERASRVLGKRLLNKALQDTGYDAITHTGGGNTGNKSHQVVIVFKPEQVIGAFGGLDRKATLGPEALSPDAAGAPPTTQAPKPSAKPLTPGATPQDDRKKK